MWRVILLSIVLGGCVQLPPTPQDIQAKKFEPVADKAVIYLVHNSPDAGWRGTALVLGDETHITTYPGTYFRWEVAPGTQSIRGGAGYFGMITLRSEPGRIYYVLQNTGGGHMPPSMFQLMNDQEGRAAVRRSVLVSSQ